MVDFYLFLQNLDSVSSVLAKRDELNNSGEIAKIKEKISGDGEIDKKSLGKELNILKQNLQKAVDRRIQEIQAIKEQDTFIEFDATFYSENYLIYPAPLHPVTQITKEVVEIFQGMGFFVSDGPWVSTQENTFTLLNMPDYHPARAMQDTFYLAEKDQLGENLVLRTHTSSHQVPYTRTRELPIRAVFPGQVYRNENMDSTHDIMFHQIECLYIDKRVSLSHLISLIETFFKKLFVNNQLSFRFRSSYFPYTIPSLEVDISNPFKNDGSWIEAGGCGLVHPEVITNMGLDCKEYQGLAFGFGLDRITQLKFGISGMGQFFNGHLSFLKGVGA